jgi:Tfp pilus assembly protein PilF
MIATQTSPTEPALTADHGYQKALRQTLLQAVVCHEASQLQEAEQLYRAVLQAQPEHPEANHNLGVLLMELQQPGAGLPHFEAALAAQPESERYWVSYVGALAQAGQTELAQQMLKFGREHGLAGEVADTLAQILGAGPAASAIAAH